MTATPAPSAPRQVGRYAIYDPIATGGMATVHLGRLVGPVGFARTVAIKRLHPQFARDPEFVSMFLDEARLAARIQHPNVVPTLDVIATDGELLLVMDYIRGETLSRLIREVKQRGGQRIPTNIVVSMMAGALHGLHAAHEAMDESGHLLGIIHRDVSPQNVIVGMDGVARVLDFGVAKAEDRIQVTQDQKVKGKLLYMSPEQLENRDVDRRTDIYAMGIVLFEALTGTRMFLGEREAARLLQITRGEIRMPSAVVPELAPFDAVVRKAAALDPAQRYATAREMARALETVMPAASTSDVGEWVQTTAGETITERTKLVAELESVNRRAGPNLREALAEELRNSSRDMHSLADPSSPSMAQPIARPRSAWPWVAIAVACVSLAVGATALARLQRAAPAPAKETAQAHGPATQPTQPPTTQVVVAAPPPTTFELPDESASVTSSGATAAPPPPVNAAISHRPAGGSSTKRDCDQPYVVDSTGHMHFRKECL